MKKIEYDENQILKWDKKYPPSVVVEKTVKKYGIAKSTAKNNISRIRTKNKANIKINCNYGPKEKIIIINCIRNNNLNLRKGFEEAALQLDLNPFTIRSYYYYTLRYEMPLFASVGKQKAINTKNVFQGREIPEGLSLTGKIFRILKTLI